MALNNPGAPVGGAAAVQGTFVLQDVKFKLLTRLSGAGDTKAAAMPYLGYTCGMLRGALANLGIACTVTPDIVAIPTCTFTIKIKQ